MMGDGISVINSLADLRVLAVEDNVQARALLRSTLKELGIDQIFMAKDGKEALDFLADCDEMINVIVCDWNMPRVTGLEILRQVRTVDRDIPFMMLTGAADLDSVSIAKESGVTSYLAKPYSQDDLGKKLKQILRILKVRQDVMA
jgi:two-component system chemotaxis response regulator CheY